MNIPRPKLNVIELALFAAFVGILAYNGGVARTRFEWQPYLSREGYELKVLENRFGRAHNSEHGEEWIIRDFFSDQRDGVFVDVGANHHQHFSNTYFLETTLGWSGVAIEPQIKFAGGWASGRPRTKFIPLFVSDVSNREATLYVPSNDLIASASPAFVEAEDGTSVKPVKVNTTTLDDVLERSGISRIDFLSIDVELHEPEVLKGFSIARFQPTLVCIESHPEVRQKILDYFAGHGYIVVGKYLRADTANLWFALRGRA